MASEEEALVRHLKNKNRALQGMNRKETWDGKLDLTRIFNHDEMPQFIDYGTSSKE